MSASEVEGTRNRLSGIQIIRMIAGILPLAATIALLAWGMFLYAMCRLAGFLCRNRLQCCLQLFGCWGARIAVYDGQFLRRTAPGTLGA